jgi:hypothetical protein
MPEACGRARPRGRAPDAQHPLTTANASPLLLEFATGSFQRLCEDPNYVKFGEMHSVIVAPLLI